MTHINNLAWSFLSYLTFALYLLHKYPTSIKTTIEFFDELLTHRDYFLEVWDKYLAFSPRGQSMYYSDDVLDLKQTN